MENQTTTSIQTVSDNNPIKEAEYEKYCLWKRLPLAFKAPPKDKTTGMRPTPAEFCEVMGIQDSLILELVELKTQKAFAEKYGVSEDTLSLWNKTLGVRSALQDIRKWATHMTQGILLSMGNKALRKGDWPEVKLWLQTIEGWEEKQRVEHEYKGTQVIEISEADDKDTMETNKEAETGLEIPDEQDHE